jgi:hypothetical protein
MYMSIDSFLYKYNDIVGSWIDWNIYIYSVHTCTFIDLCMYTNVTNSQQNNS